MTSETESVFIEPSATQLTVTPCLPTARASPRENPAAPAFAPLYDDQVGFTDAARVRDDRHDPAPALFHHVRDTARVAFNTPNRLAPSHRSQSRGLVSQNGGPAEQAAAGCAGVADVVDEHVHDTNPTSDVGDHGLDRVEVSDVAARGRRRMTKAGQLGHDLFGTVEVEVVDHDGRPEVGAAVRDRLPDALAGPGDKRDASGQGVRAGARCALIGQ